MFLKTTNINFQAFGTTYAENGPRSKRGITNNVEFTIDNKQVNKLYKAEQDIYFKVTEGIVLLVVTDKINENKTQGFVVHSVVQVDKGVYYNFISMTPTSSIELSTLNKYEDKAHPLNENFEYIPIKSRVLVKEIMSYYYIVRGTHYYFPGEKHNFWELTLVDNGTLHTEIDGQEFTLSNNDCIMYAPGQFHTQYTKEFESCSHLTIIFDMDIERPELISNKVFKTGRTIRTYIEDFVNGANQSSIYNDDILITDLQRTIIGLLQENITKDKPLANTPMQQKFESELLDGILNYVNENIYTALSIEDLCEKFSISRSSLQVLFKNNLGVPPKQYISEIKLEKSKQLIKESKYTISEISSICGFASIHYFSRRFKSVYGITPTDYAKSLYK